MKESVLIIEQMGLPPFSARGCTQTLVPQTQGQLLRTVDGRLVFTAPEGHAKYESIISCKDENGPALNHLWRGSTVTVNCLQRLCQEVAGGASQVSLLRCARVGSFVFMDSQGKEQAVSARLEADQLLLDTALPGTGPWYMSYCPRLHMVVKEFSLETNEWGQEVGWTLHLQEA